MDLAELKFVVKTEQLDEAATKIKELAVEVSKLNKPVTDAALKSEKLAQAQAKTARETAKLEEANTKAAIAAEKLAQAQKGATESGKTHMSILEKQTSITSYMSDGLSKSMATIMSYGKASGLAASELKLLLDTLQTQKKFSGDPFDNSLSGVTSLKNQLSILREVQRLYGTGVELTSKQVRELASDKERLIVKLKEEGASLSTIKDSLRNLKSEYIGLATSINKLSDAEQQMIKQQNDAARANAYLAKETERVNRLNAESESITSATNNRLIKYEQALKASGASASEAATRLAAYRNELIATQKAAGNRQIDYLSRALGPQITDIGVGLLTGQAPLTILLQQGGQLRDQFALAGVAGADMGKMLVEASKAMVVSIKDIGLAVGQLVTGALAGTGKAITNAFIAPFERASEVREARKQLDEGMISNLRYARLTEVANGRLIQSFLSMGKVVGGVALIALGLFAKGLYDVIKQQDQLTTQLVLTGASLGVNTAQATSYANSLNDIGVTTNSALKVIAAMAKEGGFLANEITMVVTAANNLKFAGVAIEDTVKQFAKLKEKPVEALIEIAKATGLVKPEIVALVSELQQQGKTSEAAAIAMKAYADVTIAQKDRLKQELSGFAVFMKTLSSSVGEFFDEVFRGLWRRTSPTEAIKREIKELENTIKMGTQASPNTRAQNDATLAALKEQLRLSQMASDAETTRSSDNIRAAKALGEWQQLSVANLDKEKKAELDIANIRKVGLEAKKSEAEIEKLIAAYKEKNKPAKAAKETKEVTDLEKERIAFLKVMSDLEDRSAGFTKNYSDQLNLLNIGLVEGWISQDEFNMKLQELNIIQPSVIKAYKDQDEALKKVIETQKKADDAMIAAIDNSIALNNSVKEESNELILQAQLIGQTDQERKKAIKTRQAELLLAKELAEIGKLKSLDNGQDIIELQNQAYKRFADRTKNINTEIANDFVEKQLAEYNRISDGLTDAVVTGLFEGGKSGRKKLRDLIVAELRKPITIVVKAIVDATLGSFIQSVIGGAGGDVLGSFAGSATGSAATGGLAGIQIGGASLGSLGTAFGQGMASGFGYGGNAIASIEAGSAQATAFNAGGYAAPVAGALAGVYGGRAISNGYSLNGGSGNSTVNAGTAAGAYIGSVILPGIGTALGAAAGGLLGGAFNRTFGRTLKDVGIRGTLGGETGFQGERYTFEKGGLFRSNKTRTSMLEEADRSAIASDFRLIKGSVMELAESAGFGSDALKDFTAKFQINLKDLSPEEAVKKYQEEFAKVEESMAEAIVGTSGYRRENETSIQALTRIASFMGGVNDAFEKLGFETYKLELASLDAAQSFVDLFGGIENFSKAMGFFYENFFTDEEKIINLTKDLSAEFAKLGKELPSTREDFKQMVIQAQKAGDTTLVKNLTDLQYAFTDLVPVVDNAAQAIDENLTSAVAGIVDEINRLRGGTTTQTGLETQFAILTAQARSGDVEALAKLPSITQDLEKIASETAVNATDVIMARARHLLYLLQALLLRLVLPQVTKNY
jgi:phage-related minor tail protein